MNRENNTIVSILPYTNAMSVECREFGSMWTAVYHCHCDNNKNYAAFIAGLCLFYSSLKFNLFKILFWKLSKWKLNRRTRKMNGIIHKKTQELNNDRKKRKKRSPENRRTNADGPNILFTEHVRRHKKIVYS